MMKYINSALAYWAHKSQQHTERYQSDYRQALILAILLEIPEANLRNNASIPDLLNEYKRAVQSSLDEGIDEETHFEGEMGILLQVLEDKELPYDGLLLQFTYHLNRLYALDKLKLKQFLRNKVWDAILKKNLTELILLVASFDNDYRPLKERLLIDALGQGKRDVFKDLLEIGVVPTFKVLEKAVESDEPYYLEALLNESQYPQCLYDSSPFYNELVTKHYFNPSLYQYRQKHASSTSLFFMPASPKFVCHAAWLGMILGGLAGFGFCLAVLFAIPIGGAILSVMAKLSLGMIKGLTLNLDGLYHAMSDLAATGYGDVLIPFVFIVLLIVIIMPYVIPPLLSTGLGMLCGGLSLGIAAYVLDRAVTAIKEGVHKISSLFESSSKHEVIDTREDDAKDIEETLYVVSSMN